MQNIDKAEFGRFVSMLRKEKGLTQKELATQLFVSDKAVSKWETGQSIPTVDLLIPLAEALGVTVTELLECRKMETPQPISVEDVETIVKKAVSYVDEETGKRKINKKYLPIYCISLVVVFAQLAGLPYILASDSGIYSAIQITLLMSAIFGAYFMLCVKERLPAFYDENKISFYSDGPFRMNLAGIHINNSNWPHIVRFIRLWCFIMMNLTAVIYVMFYTVFIRLSDYVGDWLITAAAPFITFLTVIVALFIPVYFIGKKYE